MYRGADMDGNADMADDSDDHRRDTMLQHSCDHKHDLADGNNWTRIRY